MSTPNTQGPASQATVVITLADVYVELRQLGQKVDNMAPQAQQVTDHETRLRALERWRYALPTAVLFALASVATSIAALLPHK